MARRRPPETAPPDEGLTDGQIVGLEHYPAQVLHTPGHTQGSICLHFAPLKLLVAGDTLFAGSIGRTDLPGGNFDQIIDSLRGRLLTLPDETKVLPGHGPATTIGEERASNPFLQKREVESRYLCGTNSWLLTASTSLIAFSYIARLLQQTVIVEALVMLLCDSFENS